MAQTEKATEQSGYIRNLVNLQQLFESGETKEPSIRALRSRAEDDILVFVESKEKSHYFDEQLSVMRVVVARLCKGIGVRWKDISKIMNRDSAFFKETIVERLNNGETQSDIIENLSTRLRKALS